jgi:hypothetical protein
VVPLGAAALGVLLTATALRHRTPRP